MLSQSTSPPSHFAATNDVPQRTSIIVGGGGTKDEWPGRMA